MGLREWSNAHQKLTAGAAAIGVSACFVGLVYGFMSDHRLPIGVMPDHYFSVDDGKTYFASSGANVPPFDYQGQPAVRVHLYEADGQRFVGYLERYKPEAQKAKIAKTITPQQELDGRELKKPGDAKWLPTSEHAAVGKLLRIAAPPGSSAVPVPVEP